MKTYAITRSDNRKDRLRADRVDVKDGCLIFWLKKQVVAVLSPSEWALVVDSDLLKDKK